MTRENSIRRYSRKGANVSHQILVIIITFALGYFTASIFNIDALSTWISHHSDNQQKPIETVEVHSKPKDESPAKPKFEFYTLLANEKGVDGGQVKGLASEDAAKAQEEKVALKEGDALVSAAEQTKNVTIKQLEPVKLSDNKQQQVKPAVRQVPKPEKPQIAKQIPKPRGRFLVQVASFKIRNDAEHMKGTLTLKGFEVNVVTISTPQKGVWYRVVVGPYPNRDLAQKAQVILSSSERLHGMVVAG
jgi:cell division protein FtsN